MPQNDPSWADSKHNQVRRNLVTMHTGEHSTNGTSSDRETLFMLSGIALMIFGAGLVLSNPVVQKYLGKAGVGNLAQAALPDIERYMRLRAM
jgi:hypothetical protein